MVGIYKITSPSGKIYIGQSWDISRRWPQYRSNTKQQVINASISKYGYDNHLFEVVHELPRDVSQRIMDEYEILYWEMYKSVGIEMMNIRIPGKTGGKPSGWKHTEEAKKKISEAKKSCGIHGLGKTSVIKMNMEGEIIETYPSVLAAAGSKNRTSGISMCCSSKYKRKSAYGFKWAYSHQD